MTDGFAKLKFCGMPRPGFAKDVAWFKDLAGTTTVALHARSKSALDHFKTGI